MVARETNRPAQTLGPAPGSKPFELTAESMRQIHKRATDERQVQLEELARLAKRAANAKGDLERAILHAIHQGYSLREIAEYADLSHNSVRRRVQRHFS